MAGLMVILLFLPMSLAVPVPNTNCSGLFEYPGGCSPGACTYRAQYEVERLHLSSCGE